MSWSLEEVTCPGGDPQAAQTSHSLRLSLQGCTIFYMPFIPSLCRMLWERDARTVWVKSVDSRKGL